MGQHYNQSPCLPALFFIYLHTELPLRGLLALRACGICFLIQHPPSVYPGMLLSRHTSVMHSSVCPASLPSAGQIPPHEAWGNDEQMWAWHTPCQEPARDGHRLAPGVLCCTAQSCWERGGPSCLAQEPIPAALPFRESSHTAGGCTVLKSTSPPLLECEPRTQLTLPSQPIPHTHSALSQRAQRPVAYSIPPLRATAITDLTVGDPYSIPEPAGL